MWRSAVSGTSRSWPYTAKEEEEHGRLSCTPTISSCRTPIPTQCLAQLPRHRSSLGDGCGAYVLSVLVAANRRGEIAVEKRRAVGPTREVPAHHPAVVVSGRSCSQQRSAVKLTAISHSPSRPLLHSPSATEIFPATMRGGPLAQEGGGGGWRAVAREPGASTVMPADTTSVLSERAKHPQPPEPPQKSTGAAHC